jgi:hypothetical protein
MASETPGLFQRLPLTAGGTAGWRIDCRALSDADYVCLAQLTAARAGNFGSVEAVVPGGERLAAALRLHITRGPLLLAADVLQTGATMERQRAGRDVAGVVLFARGPCPAWVQPVFTGASLLEQAQNDLDQLRERVRYWQPSGAADPLAAVDALGAARNDLLLRTGLAEGKAAMATAAVPLLQKGLAGADPELIVELRRWLAQYESLGGHEGH